MIARLTEHHTISFAIGHLSRGAVVAVIGILFGISAEADRIFFVYYIMAIPLSVVALTVQFSISHMRALNQVAWQIMLGGGVSCGLVALTLYLCTGDALAIQMWPWSLVAFAGTLLYGANAAHGHLRLIPLAQVGSAGVLMLLLGLSLGGLTQGFNIALALFLSESTYALILFYGLRRADKQALSKDWRGMFRQFARQLPRGMAISLAAPVLRLTGGLFGEGWVSIFTYVSVLVITGMVILTAGYRATVGWKRASQK